MATLVGMQGNPVSLLRSLVELDFDAVEAYDAAIRKLENGAYRERLSSFRDDHIRHVADLNKVIERLGGRPVHGPDLKRVLTKGKILLAAVVSDDAILFAMKTNETDTNTAYERAVAHHNLDAQTLAVLQRNLADERRHRAWLVATLSKKVDRVEDSERMSTPSAV